MSGCEDEYLARDLGVHPWVQWYLTLSLQCHWETVLNHHWPDSVHAFPTTATTLDCQSDSGSSSLGRISSSAMSTDQRYLKAILTCCLPAADYCTILRC